MPKITLKKEGINRPESHNYFKLLYNYLNSQRIEVKGHEMRYKPKKQKATYIFNIKQKVKKSKLEKFMSELENELNEELNKKVDSEKVIFI